MGTEQNPPLQEPGLSSPARVPRAAGGEPGLLFRDRAEALTKTGTKAALQQLRQALRLAQRKNDKGAMGWALLNTAMILRGQRHYSPLVKILEEAQNCFVATENELGVASVAQELSIVNRELDRNTLALEYAHKAARIFQALGRMLELGWAYDNLAVIYFNRFQRHESLTYAKKAHGIFVEFNSQNGLAWNSCNLASLYLEMGFYSMAARHYAEALQTFEQLGSNQGKAWALLGLATVERAQCRFDVAEGLLLKAKDIFEELDLKDRVGWCLLHIAAIKRARGQEEVAVLLNKQALHLFGPLRNHDGVAWSYFQIGQVFRDRGQLIKAWQTLREGLNLHADISNRSGMGWAENELGEAYLKLNDLSHARECFIKAKVTAEQLDAGPLKSEVEKNLAALHLEEGFLQKANELLDKAEALCQKIKSYEILCDVFLTRARYWILLGDAKKARQCLDSANTFIEAYDLNRLRPIIGVYLGEILVMEGKAYEASKVWQDTTQLAKKMQLRRQRAEALLGLVQVEREKKTASQLALALFHIEKDVRAISSRKMKGKFLAVKGLITYRTNRFLDTRFFFQSLHILNAAGLPVLERQILELTGELFRREDREREMKEFQQDLKTLLDKGPVDLHLVHPRRDFVDTLAVSLAV